MICIYHNRDLDGFTSGAIVKRKYPDAKLIGFDYSDSIADLLNQIPQGEEVIMIDVSLPMVAMMVLSDRTDHKFTWIDHHISAIKEFEALDHPNKQFIKAVLQNGIAACEVGWNYLFPNEKMPEAVKLLGEYDTWRNQDKERWENKILPFQFGMRLNCNSPETFPKELIPLDLNEVNDRIFWIIEQGKIILQYQSQVNELNCKKAAFECEFEGLRAICLNGGGFNSDVFKSVYDESKHDIMMPFQFNGKQWTVSLYTTKDNVDCSAIAKSKGGGGHLKASGFQVSDIKTIFPKNF